MKHACSLFLLLALAVLPAQAHFVWLLPGAGPDGKPYVRVIFSDSLQPDAPDLLKKISQTKVFLRGADGKAVPVKMDAGRQWYEADIPSRGFCMVGATCDYGVIQRGESEPFWLNYYAKSFLGTPGSDGIPAALRQPSDPLPLEVMPVGGQQQVQVLWRGKPLAGAEVTLLVPGLDKPVVTKSDDQGKVELTEPKKKGLYGIRARHMEAKPGEKDGKKYKEIRYYSTLTLEPGERGGIRPAAFETLKADPAATKLLADARAARALWKEFPGFTADLEINLNGKVRRGTVSVGSKGDVDIKLKDNDPAALAWAKRELGSLVGHRLDSGEVRETPCAFLDDNANYPLGRAIRVLNDEFHSSYRIRDRQILEVNRRMGDSRFTISVVENRLAAEKHYLPVCYTVTTWNARGELQSTQAHRHTWQRVGGYDLPTGLLVVISRPEPAESPEVKKQLAAPAKEARELRLSNLKLAARP